jgi:uncharacterized repeat protein (TIGR01451 family)
MRAVSPPFSLCVPAADLTVTLDDGVASANPGATVTYTLTVANDGPDDVTGVTVTDTFPAAVSGVTWSCASGGGGGVCGAASGSGDLAETVDLPAGGSVVFTIHADVDPAATGTLNDTASAALPSGLHELTPADNSATDSDTLVPSTDLSITNDDSQTSAVPGTTATYTVTVTNAGPSDALDAQVTDLFPAPLTGVTWSCSGSGSGSCAASGSGDIEQTVDLPVGAMATFTATGTIDPAATGTLTTSATVLPTFPSTATNQVLPEGTPGGGDPDPSNNNAVDVDTLTPQVDLSITKDDGLTVAVPGEPLTYSIVASNPGPSAAFAATVEDSFPADLVGVTWSCAGAGGGTCTASGSGDVGDTIDLPVGASVTYTVEVTVAAGSTAATLSNTATVGVPAGVTEMDGSDNSAVDVDTLTPSTDLAISNDDGQTSAVPGTTVTYTVMVTNAGPSDALGAQVEDLFPAALLGVTWSCAGSTGGSCAASGSGDVQESVDLPVGAIVTLTATGTIDPAATGTLETSATASSSGDPDPSNNTALDIDILTPAADLAIAKDDGVTVALPGQALTYTLTASNPGPSSVFGATVEDAFPTDLVGVTWTCAGTGGGACTASGRGDVSDTVDLPAGASVTYTATATVDPASTATAISNTATVSAPAGVTELDPADNTATDVDAGLVVFRDGFESGDTSAWSATVP